MAFASSLVVFLSLCPGFIARAFLRGFSAERAIRMQEVVVRFSLTPPSIGMEGDFHLARPSRSGHFIAATRWGQGGGSRRRSYPNGIAEDRTRRGAEARRPERLHSAHAGQCNSGGSQRTDNRPSRSIEAPQRWSEWWGDDSPTAPTAVGQPGCKGGRMPWADGRVRRTATRQRAPLQAGCPSAARGRWDTGALAPEHLVGRPAREAKCAGPQGVLRTPRSPQGEEAEPRLVSQSRERVSSTRGAIRGNNGMEFPR